MLPNSIAEKIQGMIIRGMDIKSSNEAADLIRQLEIPVYFFGGIYNYTINYTEGKAYLKELEASVKGFYTFNKSAHQLIFEEPDRFMEIIKTDVLNGTTTLADTD